MADAPNPEAVAALKASPEYQALGVIGRDRLLRDTFPMIDEAIKASGARIAERWKTGAPPDEGAEAR